MEVTGALPSPLCQKDKKKAHSRPGHLLSHLMAYTVRAPRGHMDIQNCHLPSFHGSDSPVLSHHKCHGVRDQFFLMCHGLQVTSEFLCWTATLPSERLLSGASCSFWLSPPPSCAFSNMQNANVALTPEPTNFHRARPCVLELRVSLLA